MLAASGNPDNRAEKFLVKQASVHMILEDNADKGKPNGLRSVDFTAVRPAWRTTMDNSAILNQIRTLAHSERMRPCRPIEMASVAHAGRANPQQQAIVSVSLGFCAASTIRIRND